MLRNDIVDPDATRFTMEDTMNHTRFIRPIIRKRFWLLLFYTPLGMLIFLFRIVFVFFAELLFFRMSSLLHCEHQFYKGMHKYLF